MSPSVTPQDRPNSASANNNYGPDGHGGNMGGGVGPPPMQHDLEVAQACLNLRQESKGGDHLRQQGDDPRSGSQTPQQMDPRSGMMNSMSSMAPMPPIPPEGSRLGMPMQQMQMPGSFMPSHMMDIGGANGHGGMAGGMPGSMQGGPMPGGMQGGPMPGGMQGGMPGGMKDMHPYYNNMVENGGGGHFPYSQFPTPEAEQYHAMMNGMGAMRDMSSYYSMMNQNETNMMNPNTHFYPQMMPPESGHFNSMMNQNYPQVQGGYMQQKRPHPDEFAMQNDFKRRRSSNASPSLKPDDNSVRSKKVPEKQKKGKRASDMPRRPLSAYNFFFSEERERILAAIPDPDGENGKKVGEATAEKKEGEESTTEKKEEESTDVKKDEPAGEKKEEATADEKDGSPKKEEGDKETTKAELKEESGDGAKPKVEGEGEGDKETDVKAKEEEKTKEEKQLIEIKLTKEEINEKMAARSKRLLALREQQSNKRRPHRKTHGKIGFKELVKKIGERWRALPADQKEYYSGLAETDLRRYKEQMTEYNTKNNRIGA